MARYYISKTPTFSHDVVGPTKVQVVAAHEGDGSEPVPAGYVSGKFTTESHTPNFSNEKADTPAHGDAESRRWQTLANSTGYSVPYIRNYYRDLLFDVNSGTPDDKAENRRGLLYDASNITSSTDIKKYEDLDPAWSREVARSARRQNIRGARAISALRKDPAFAPDQLFTSRPDSLEVDFADFDPRARTLFPTAVSLMSQSVGHPQIVANDDLSEHSSAVAQRAAEKGVVVPHRHNPDMVVTNDMRSKTRTADASLLHNVDRGFGGRIQVSGQGEMGGFSRVPDEDVASARGHLRTMLRGDRPQKPPVSPKPNMSQQFLPGMEGFV